MLIVIFRDNDRKLRKYKTQVKHFQDILPTPSIQ